MDLSSLAVTHQATINEEHLDEMGHMNVMWYTHFFDRATFVFFERFGMDLAYFETTKAGAFALEQHTRYLVELRQGQSITVRSRAIGRSAKRFHFMHFMAENGSGRLAATTEIVGIHVDLNTRRSSPIPAVLAAKFDQILERHQQLEWKAPLCGVIRP
jgi:acyl-CoA thioester hydrolase